MTAIDDTNDEGAAPTAISTEDATSYLESNGGGIELVFGLVGPTGVELEKVYESLKIQLKTVGYEAEVIRLSNLITPFLIGVAENFSSEFERIEKLMESGTTLRAANKSLSSSNARCAFDAVWGKTETKKSAQRCTKELRHCCP